MALSDVSLRRKTTVYRAAFNAIENYSFANIPIDVQGKHIAMRHQQQKCRLRRGFGRGGIGT
jgi:hypothetical protein